MVDLNKLREKLKQRRPAGVDRDGKLDDKNPANNGTKPSPSGQTTLEPKRFFV